MSPTKVPNIVVGIDFGTTFSGVAWALSDDLEDIEVIQTWPGGGNNTSQKVPTILSQKKPHRWGYQVTEQMESIQGVKLLLDGSQKFRYLPAVESEAAIENMKSTPIEVSGKYLKFLVDHAKELLQKRFGTALRTMQLDYILTVPAVWSDKAKDATLQAACLAGISRSNLFLLSEPEAAAVYAIRTIQPNSLAEGDCFVVCDAGGGTVDLITYRINQSEPLRLEEVTEGTGAVCGSAMLDERFEDFMIKSLGQETYQKLSKPAKTFAMKHWQDYIKTTYAGPLGSEEFDDPGYLVPIPGLPDISGGASDEGFLHMESKDVQSIFDPIVNQIQCLITDQMLRVKKADHSTKAIILVGGLGASEYLFGQLQNKFPNISVMHPKNAWSAVVRGAVHRGIEGNQVENRKSRSHYGISCRETYDTEKHHGQKPHWCPLEEVWKVNGQMSWHIKKGDAISEANPIKLDFYRVVNQLCSGTLRFKEELQFCVAEEAPSTHTASVSRLCELEADLTKVPKALFEHCHNSRGEKYYKVPFVLSLTPTSASLLFNLEFNGISYGTVRTRY